MKVLKNVLTWIIILVLLLGLAVGALMLTGKMANPFSTKQEANITAEKVEEQISKASDLTTAKLTYNGIVHFEEGQIKFITKNSFNMMYTAYAVAGINMEDITVEVQEPTKATTAEDGTKVPAKPGKVIVNVPKAELQTLTIDSDSLKFYDEKFALFNKAEHTDVQEALQAAETDAKKNMGKKALIKEAQAQAETVIADFVSSVIPEGYELEVN